MVKLRLADQWNHSKAMYVVMLPLMTVLAVDLLIGNVADIYTVQVKSDAGFALFLTISLVSIAGQFYFLGIVKRKMNQIDSEPLRLSKVVFIIQLVLISIIILIIFQIIYGSFYFTSLLSISTAISYVLTITLMAILALRFLTWFKTSKNLALLFYGCAAGVIVLNSAFTIILFDSILMKKPPVITLSSEIIFDLGYEPGTFMSYVITIQAYTFTAFIVLTWGGTIMIIHHNIQRVGKVKFWVLVLLPLIYFLSYFITLYQQIYPDSTVTQAISENFAIPILLGTASVTACGILFGLSFLLIARSISLTSHIREYMLITGFGFMLFFNTGSATVLQAAYPPFGLPNVSFVGLAAYLIFFGLYHSALSIAHDVKLRQLVRDSLRKDSGFLKSIGDAQMLGELEGKILEITKKNSDTLEEKSGEESSMSDEEIKGYVHYVLEEIRTRKNIATG
jgi:hypothetical protein